MPTARDVFDHPESHWAFLTVANDVSFEGQHFDRKEAGRPDADGRLSKAELRRLRVELVACTVSAFANSNRDGGLLVLGISKNGVVTGLSHLTEEQLNALTNPYDVVIGHSTAVRNYPCINEHGGSDHIALFFVPYSERTICETFDHRAWERRGAQNAPLSPDRLDAIRRGKGVLDYERLPVCELEIDDIDRGVLQEFRSGVLSESTIARSDTDALRAVGASEAFRTGSTELTVAGALFFHANPQRVMPWATVRLVRYNVALADRDR